MTVPPAIGQGVLAAQAVVRGGRVDRAAQDVQVVLGGDRVRRTGSHVEGARPGDRQVHVGVDHGVRVLGAGVGAVGDRRGAFEGQDEVVAAGRLDRGARRGGDGRVVEDQDDLVLGPCGHDDLACEGAAELVDAGLGDGQHAVAHAHGVGRGGRGRAAERHVDGVRGLPVAVLHVGGLRVRGQGVGRGGRRGRVAVGSGGSDGAVALVAPGRTGDAAPEEPQAPSANVPTRAIAPIVRAGVRFSAGLSCVCLFRAIKAYVSYAQRLRVAHFDDCAQV